MSVNTTSASSVNTNSNIIAFNSSEKNEFSQAIQLWVKDKRVSDALSAKEIGSLAAFDRIDTLRKAELAGMAVFCRNNPRADATLAIYHLIMMMADNDDGRCRLSQTQIGKIFGRCERAVRDALDRLQDSHLVIIVSKPGRAAEYEPVVMRTNWANHRVWFTENLASTPAVKFRGTQAVKFRGREVNPGSEVPNDPGSDVPHTLITLKEDNSLNTGAARTGKAAGATVMFGAAALLSAAAASPLPPVVDAPSLPGIESTCAQRPRDGTRLPDNWFLPKPWGERAMKVFERDREWVKKEEERFRWYYTKKAPDCKAIKKDWKATWMNWCKKRVVSENKSTKTGARTYSGSKVYLGETL
jgi:hypothetical protein